MKFRLNCRNWGRYVPQHSENRMRHEGDLGSARQAFLAANNKNLMFLLNKRYAWISPHISLDLIGLELGSGIGASKHFLDLPNLQLSDVGENPWLDHPNVDAMDTGFAANSFDYLIASNMIHHLSKPHDFFREASRILKPNGLLFINEAHTSFFSKLVLRIMRHEGWDETIDVFDKNTICNDPSDPWSANCSIPRLFFDNPAKFEEVFPEWRIVNDVKVEFMLFLNSGGVTAKFFYIPLSKGLLNIISKVDDLLIRLAPNFFALGRQIILRKEVAHG